MNKKLNEKEQKAQKVFFDSLKIYPVRSPFRNRNGIPPRGITSNGVYPRKTKIPVIAAMVGSVGSGKSTISRFIAQLIKGTVIQGDKIRVLLRRQKCGYESVREITKNTLVGIISKGGNAVLDSDYGPIKKKGMLSDIAKKFGAKVFYIQTYADRDIIIGRLINAKYSPKSFSGGAGSVWTGKNKGAVVAIREFWRMTPRNYKSNNKEPLNFILKKFPFINFKVDTSDEKKWKKEAKKIAKEILKF
ncbi:MAG: hypothetical protein A3H02_02740 [Candidatus Niyogibacteria bacterium RIFCSPLOWO2_12_FULL_41_13]|uniref:UDP-N-acetylglucosamine kinase n=1 Tax=Candidatus Niyogibacteria bacterium RIFCSPLOWO2_12_FULL_41_13 TaxID=1801726 RepID=A0A1G2F1W9_9BACT|nr:MAG: hypothetical protein A3H02_02740 [Candidatus Niyogibacteria bacterium RIFCSPLOWO2_12_FULL_41_13]